MAKTELFSRRQVGGSFVYTDESRTTGEIYFVCSVTGTNSAGYGRNPDSPFATIGYALAQCTSGKHDRVYVMSDHAETLTGASGIDFVATGSSVYGIGQGTNKPTVTMGTATTASVDFSVANCRLSNIRFVNNIDSLAAFIEGGAGGATIENCEFVTSSTKEALAGISIPTTYDDWTIRNCKFIQPTDPAGTNGGAGTGAIYLVDSENVLIEGCEFRGNWETAFVHNRTTGAANLWVRDCWGICSLADAVPFVQATGCTGGAVRCSFITPAETQVTEATLSGTFQAGFFNFASFYGNDGGGGQLAVAGQAAAT